MPNRQAVDSQRFTLRIPAHNITISGFTRVATANHDRRTGRVTPSGAKGDIVTVSAAVEGGLHTLTKQWDAAEYAALKAVRNPDGTLTGDVVDGNNAKIGNGDRYTGVFKGASKAGLDTNSAEPLTMEIRFDADGEVG
jgi:mitochondrial fission protein ELM1